LLAAVLIGGTAGGAAADVNLSVNLGPPPIVAAEPPEVVLVPGSDVYFVPGYDYDVFYYGGYWWSPRGAVWYRAPAYSGPWRAVPRRFVPGPIFGVPRDYRRVYLRERHIPYREWHEHGRGHWEHERGHDRGEHRGERW
jgi:hypothetical protein